MDKPTFDKITSELPSHQTAYFYNTCHQQRQEQIRMFAAVALTPNRTIDYLLVNALAVVAMRGVPAEVEKMVPELKKRIEQYLRVQAALMQDLSKINKEISQDVSFFRPWL